jgi:aryl carrier-like protein
LSLPGRLLALGQQPRVVSLGGATEASIWSIVQPIESVDPSWSSIPYGRPLANQQWHVLNGVMDACPEWTTGQLYIGGLGLARGYWRDPERTSASFITDPRSGERLYATGDLGRYLPDGTIELLGREDHQVKIRGHRIELGEIEATLLGHEDVADVAAIVRGSAELDKRLIACVVLRPGASVTRQDLQVFTAERLPHHMVPSFVLLLDRLPLSPNGKIDRRALSSLESTAQTRETPREMPTTVLERALSRALCEVLEAEPADVDVDTNFFDLGANSLTMIQFQARLSLSTGEVVPTVDLFRYPTIRLLAQHLAARHGQLANDDIGERARRQRSALRRTVRPTRPKRP